MKTHISKTLTTLTIFSIILFFNGCKEVLSETEEEFNNLPTTFKGKFLDSEVKGLKYTTNSLSGTTDVNGYFNYKPGEDINFYINDKKIGSTVKAANIITPAVLTNEFDKETPLSFQTETKNILVLLQSLDKDNNADNGIDLDINSSVSFSDISTNNIVSIENKLITLGKVKKSESDSLNHFKNTIDNLNEIKYTSTYYNSQGELGIYIKFSLSLSIHGNTISGTLTDTLNEYDFDNNKDYIENTYQISGVFEDNKLKIISNKIDYQYKFIFEKDLYSDDYIGKIDRSDISSTHTEDLEIYLYKTIEEE